MFFYLSSPFPSMTEHNSQTIKQLHLLLKLDPSNIFFIFAMISHILHCCHFCNFFTVYITQIPTFSLKKFMRNRKINVVDWTRDQNVLIILSLILSSVIMEGSSAFSSLTARHKGHLNLLLPCTVRLYTPDRTCVGRGDYVGPGRAPEM